MPIIIGLIALAGVSSFGVYEAGNTAEKSQKLVELLVIGGGLYVAYRVAQNAGLAK